MNVNEIDVSTPEGRRALRAVVAGKLPTVTMLLDQIDSLESQHAKGRAAWQCWTEWLDQKFNESDIETIRAFDGYTDLIGYFSK